MAAVVVIGPNLALIEELQSQLAAAGHQTYSAGNIEAAYKLVKFYEPELVVMRWDAEHAGNSLALIELLRANTVATLPILVLASTGELLPQDASQLADYQCTLLIGSFTADELLRKASAAFSTPAVKAVGE